MSDPDVDLETWNEAIERISKSFDDLRITIYEQLIPPLDKLVELLTGLENPEDGDDD